MHLLLQKYLLKNENKKENLKTVTIPKRLRLNFNLFTFFNATEQEKSIGSEWWTEEQRLRKLSMGQGKQGEDVHHNSASEQ